MVVDNDGKPVPHYQIGKPYASTSYHECVDLGEAVFYATAVALHRGYSMEVRRVVPREPQSPETTGLFTITPNSFDFRKVKPETVLGMKAMAHSLVSNIDEVAPEAQQEGFTQ
jgi:hypothetical protein